MPPRARELLLLAVDDSAVSIVYKSVLYRISDGRCVRGMNVLCQPSREYYYYLPFTSSSRGASEHPFQRHRRYVSNSMSPPVGVSRVRVPYR
jgi:hypothetical protein